MNKYVSYLFSYLLALGSLVLTAVSVLIIMSALSAISKADFSLLNGFVDHRRTSITAKKFLPNGFSPYMQNGSTLNAGLDLDIETDILAVGYFNNKVWSLVDQSAFRWVGWNYQVGIRILPFVAVEYEHFSKHILDKVNPFMEQGNRFPVEDSVNIKLDLYNKNYRGPAVSDIF